MRASAPFVMVFGLAVLLWIFAHPAGHSFFEFLGWMGSAGAAVFAAVSARATLATVQEMRMAREQEQRPQLTLEPGSDYFQMFWPNLSAKPDDQLYPRFEQHNRTPAETIGGRPAFILENFGGGAALDITITFTLDDDDSPISLPRHYTQIPYGSTNGITLRPATGNKKVMMVSLHSPGHSFLAGAMSSAERFQSHCGPGAQRSIQLPEVVIWLLALRTMQEAAQAKGLFASPTKRTLQVQISYRSALEDELSETFVFEAQTYSSPHPINGTPAAIWSGVSPAELRVDFEFVPKPRT